MSKPRCPVCHRKGTSISYGVYRCALGHYFDDDPEEGGTHHDRDPSRRLEREEELREARRVNAEGRGQAARDFRFGGNRR